MCYPFTNSYFNHRWQVLIASTLVVPIARHSPMDSICQLLQLLTCSCEIALLCITMCRGEQLLMTHVERHSLRDFRHTRHQLRAIACNSSAKPAPVRALTCNAGEVKLIAEGPAKSHLFQTTRQFCHSLRQRSYSSGHDSAASATKSTRSAWAMAVLANCTPATSIGSCE